MPRESVVEKKSFIHELTVIGNLRIDNNLILVDTETSGTVNLDYLLNNFNNTDVVIKVRTKTEE